jgi:hypothetical protein
MNRVHTLSRPSATSKPDRFRGRFARLVLTGPAQLTSASSGLFGYQESLAVPYAETSLAVEFTGAVVLMVAAVIAVVASLATRRSHRQSF